MATTTATQANPQVVTIRGRLSWPNFTYAAALKQNERSDYKKKEEDVRPNFNLLLDSAQGDKLVAFVKDTFLPWCEAQHKISDKEKSALSPAHVKKLTRILTDADWETDPVLGFIGKVHEKTAEMAPEAVMSVKVNGFKGQDIPLKAVVKSEDQLKVNDGSIVLPSRGQIFDLDDTNLELYPGSLVAAQINLFAFTAAGNPGISASTSAAIFVGDAERFGGGGAIDEDEFFMDLED